MKTSLVAAIFTLASFAAHAVDIQSLQANAIAKQNAEAILASSAKATSERIRAQVPLLARDAMFSWFQKAQSSGVKFDAVKIEGNHYDGNGNVDYTYETVQSLGGGKFLYVRGCDILGTCEENPTVNVSGASHPSKLYVIYHSNTEPWSGDQWHPTNDWSCEIDFDSRTVYKGSCGDLLDKSKRAENITEIVTAINDALPNVFK